MYIPKKYGESRVDRCPFCQQRSTAKNGQGIPVCKDHKTAELGEMKCVCGEYLDMMEGKYGIYFVCINCGNMNLNKALSINEVKDVSEPKKPLPDFSKFNKTRQKKSSTPKEITINSDDPRYMY